MQLSAGGKFVMMCVIGMAAWWVASDGIRITTTTKLPIGPVGGTLAAMNEAGRRSSPTRSMRDGDFSQAAQAQIHDEAISGRDAGFNAPPTNRWWDDLPQLRAATGDEHISRGKQQRSCLANASTSAFSPSSATSDFMHVVFIGDSITRFLYLDLTYRLHRGGRSRGLVVNATPPEFLVNLMVPIVRSSGSSPVANRTAGEDEEEEERESVKGRNRKDWMKFFRKSLLPFDGYMRCDCSRNSLQDRNVEHRFYQHPTRSLSLSYIQLLGSTPMSMRANLREWKRRRMHHDESRHEKTEPLSALAQPAAPVDDDTSCEPEFPDGTNCKLIMNTKHTPNMPPDVDTAEGRKLLWYFQEITLLEFVKLHLPQLRPRVTHVVMNIGLWDPRPMVPHMAGIVKTLASFGIHVVWRATTQPAPVTPAMRRKWGLKHWQAMRSPRQVIDRLMRDTLCVVKNSTIPTATSSPPDAKCVGAIDAARRPLCHFYPLKPLSSPSSNVSDSRRSSLVSVIGQEMYVDTLAHFVPWVYGVWNEDLWKLLRSLKCEG
jgi:hypothetical protein